MKTAIKKNDTVVVTTGRDKGKTGKVMSVNADKGTVIVEKINMVKRHKKPTQASPQGSIIDKEAPLALSNILLFCKKCDKGVRAGKKVADDGSKSRVCRACGETL